MAGTTTNFGIPYPSVTDYVTNGATDMRLLAEEVDDILSSGTPARNILINGAMAVNQRNTPITSSNYTVDRWKLDAVGTASAVSVASNADVPSGQGFTSSLRCTTTTGSAVGDGFFESVSITQLIEGLNTSFLDFGTSSAKTINISFWVRSSVIGTHTVSIGNPASTRAYNASYTISVANTWEKKSITIVGETTGVWLKTSAASMYVSFRLQMWVGGVGTGNVWLTTPPLTSAATGTVNDLSTNGNIFAITGVQLTASSVSVPFQFKSFADDLRDCQRYFAIVGFSSATLQFIGNAAMQTTGAWEAYIPLPVPMRSAPTLYATSGASYYGIYVLNLEKRVDTVTNANNSPLNLRLYGSLVGTTSSAGAAGGLYAQNVASFIAGNAEL